MKSGLLTVCGLVFLVLAACGSSPVNDERTAAEQRQAKAAAADGRINCALEGAKAFDRTCTVEEMSGDGGTTLIVGRADVGYRRLTITTDGRGIVSADGAEPAKVAIVGEGLIEISIGDDRYRLPASIKGGS